MKRLLAAIVAVALLWSGYWFIQARSLRGSIESWFEARRADDWEASYTDLSVSGFPNRLDVTFDGLLIANPDTGTAWEAPFFQMFSLVYTPDHWIFAWPDSQTVTVEAGTYQISSDGLRASLVMDGERFLRSNLEAVTLNISGLRDLAVAGLNVGLAADEVQPEVMRLGLSAAALAGKPVALGPTGTADDVALRAEVTFDDVWTTAALKGARPQPTAIKLPLAEYRADDLDLKATGDWSVDGEGRLDGTATLRAENWRNFLNAAETNGDMPNEVAALLRETLGLIAGLSGNKKTLDLTFGFNRGSVSLGILPLGRAPRIRFD
ncbi:DUF2125 domain-containing protein [Primorskyibacter sp. 2E107]|uniref:DUF2125 domain-containing protein n=1 Tax=Primorskyibacter sp. 2E107 TaxID=3403458 RepID=UPI003AF8D440